MSEIFLSLILGPVPADEHLKLSYNSSKDDSLTEVAQTRKHTIIMFVFFSKSGTAGDPEITTGKIYPLNTVLIENRNRF